MKNIEVIIKTNFIKLDQLLKYNGIADSGGQAKEIINDFDIKVNGQICKMRGKKIYDKDKIEFNEYVITVKKEVLY